MTKTQTNELTELYSAPKCKVVKTMVKRAILALSSGNEIDLQEGEEYNWEN